SLRAVSRITTLGVRPLRTLSSAAKIAAVSPAAPPPTMATSATSAVSAPSASGGVLSAASASGAAASFGGTRRCASATLPARGAFLADRREPLLEVLGLEHLGDALRGHPPADLVGLIGRAEHDAPALAHGERRVLGDLRRELLRRVERVALVAQHV